MFGLIVINGEVAYMSGSVSEVAITYVLQAAAGAAGGMYVADVVGLPAATAPQAEFDKLQNNPLLAASLVIEAVRAMFPWWANSVTALVGEVMATTTTLMVNVVTRV
jgi:hypothetical protein